MLAYIFDKGNVFTAFTVYHYYPLLICAGIGMLVIYKGVKSDNPESKWRILFFLSFIPALSVISSMVLSLCEGSFSTKEDLPFHVCRFVALAAPFAIYYKNRFWMGIFYFWILAGTLNANITPDIMYGYPHWQYFSYWLTHSVLVIIPIYWIIVLRNRIRFKDVVNAFWTANVFLLFTLTVNLLLDSNYMYTRQKPPVSSLLDYLGPWPYYLISGQALAGVLFLILFLPFAGKFIPGSEQHS